MNFTLMEIMETEEKVHVEASSQEKAPTKNNTGGGIEDYELPKAAINRCLKNALPSRPTHKDFKTALSRSATLFVPWLLAAAQQVAAERNLKTIGASHIEEALKRLGFEEWIDAIVDRMRLEREEKLTRKRRKQQSPEDSADHENEDKEDADEDASVDEEELIVDEDKSSEDEGMNDLDGIQGTL